MYRSPRIAEMLAPEKHDIITHMKSYISIVIEWQSVIVNLNSKSPHFLQDSNQLLEFGFSKVSGVDGRFIIQK